MGELSFSEVSEEEAKQIPYPYIYVNENGSFRELTNEDKYFLQEKFHPADSGRPYVKLRYKSKTPTGNMKGFCKRSKLPKKLIAGEVPNLKKWWQFW